MMKLKTSLLHAGAFVLGVAAPTAALAASNPFTKAGQYSTDIKGASGVTGSDNLVTIIGNIINVLLGFLGILLLAYLLYAGFLWMTSGGDTEGVKKAKTMIQNSIVGLIIIAAAFAISSFVLGQLVSITGAGA